MSGKSPTKLEARLQNDLNSVDRDVKPQNSVEGLHFTKFRIITAK